MKCIGYFSRKTSLKMSGKGYWNNIMDGKNFPGRGYDTTK